MSHSFPKGLHRHFLRKPKRSDYRKFRIRTVAGPDDYASMEEVLKKECIPVNLAACRIVPCALGEEMGGYGCMAVAETRMAK